MVLPSVGSFIMAKQILNIAVLVFLASQIIRDVAFRGKSFPFVKPAIKGFPFREDT